MQMTGEIRDLEEIWCLETGLQMALFPYWWDLALQ